MGRKDSKKTRTSHSILTEDTSVGSVYNITENVKNIKKLYEMSRCLDKNLTDILLYFGERGLSPKDIGEVSGISQKTINEIFEKGKHDNDLGLVSVESDYYRAYLIGYKMFEIETAKNASKKDPMKMLAVINPEKYSDKVTDKYELPTFNISFVNCGEGQVEQVIEESEDE